jgi:tripartite ATP-independent transporter DctM subunit
MNGLVLIICFILLMILGIPIGFSMGVSCLLFFYFNDIPFSVIPQVMVSLFENFPFLAIPFFALAGQLMNTGGVTDRIFRFAKALVGHIPGGLGHANIVASMIFAGMSGSAVADSAGLGAIEIKAMVEDGYHRDFSAAVTAASSTIGPIIPPSIPFILYGAIANVSVGALFVAGAIPGVIMGLSLMLIVYFISKKKQYKIYKKGSTKELWADFKDAILSLFTPIIILGGIVLGITTPTEAAVIAVIYALFLQVFIYHEFSFKKLFESLENVAKSVGMIAFLSCTAYLFGWILSYEMIPQQFTDTVLSITSNKYIILLIINILLLLVGCFMDTPAAIVVMVPVLLPAIDLFGISRIHFGVMMTLNLMIGLLTPPVGLCVYLVSDIAKVSYEKVVKATIPFMVILVVVLILITYLPQITLFLPNLLIN